MKKKPEQILHELKHFGIPTRNWSLEESQKMVSQGLLTQKQVDEVCREFEEKESKKI